jgi:hypothetical protein
MLQQVDVDLSFSFSGVSEADVDSVFLASVLSGLVVFFMGSMWGFSTHDLMQAGVHLRI